MTAESVRRERVRNGSRRQRDLAAAEPGFDFGGFAARHFPDERPEAVRMAAFHVWARHHKTKDPTPAEVRERMVELGVTREATT